MARCKNISDYDNLPLSVGDSIKYINQDDELCYGVIVRISQDISKKFSYMVMHFFSKSDGSINLGSFTMSEETVETCFKINHLEKCKKPVFLGNIADLINK